MGGTSTPLQVGLNIAKLCTGAGLLGLPRAFQQSGIMAGIFGMILIVALNDIGCRLLVACKTAMERILSTSDRWNGIDAATLTDTRVLTVKNTYSALARLTIGRYGPTLVEASIVVTLWGACAVYLITIGQLFYEVYPVLTQIQYTFAAGLLLLPFSFCTDLSFLAWASLVGVGSYAVAYVCIFYFGATTYSLHYEWSMLGPGRFYELMEFTGVAFFSLGIPLLTFSLQESMKDQRQFLPTLDRTLAIIALVYVFIGVIGYGMFVNAPGSVHSIIISNLSSTSWYASAIKLIVAVTLVFSAPLSLVPSLNMLRGVLSIGEPAKTTSENTKLLSARPSLIETNNTVTLTYGTNGSDEYALDINGSSNGSSKAHKLDDDTASVANASPTSPLLLPLLSICSVVSITCTAMFVPCFSMVLSMIGAVTITLLCFILPPLFYLQMYSYQALEASIMERAAALLFVICGIAVMFSSFAIVSNSTCS